MNIKSLLAALVVSLSLAANGMAGQHVSDGSWSSFMRKVLKEAEQGDAKAQYSIGASYQRGYGGVPNNIAKALEWYRKAAEGGHADAQLQLGWMYRDDGYGVPNDIVKAIEWFRKAAEGGKLSATLSLANIYATDKGALHDDAKAMMWYRKTVEHPSDTTLDKDYKLWALALLASGYYWGRGVPLNYAKALSLCRKAAEESGRYCLSLLGTIYRDGKGVPQDYVEAHKWLNLAAAKGRSSYWAGKERDKLALKMTPAQIAEAQRLAREWKPKK